MAALSRGCKPRISRHHDYISGKMMSEEGRRNSILVTCHYPGQGSASDWPPLPIRNLSNGDGDGDGKENGEKAIGLDRQNNKPACVSRFLVLFFSTVNRCTTTT